MTDRLELSRKWRIIGLAAALVCLAVIGFGIWWIIQLEPAWLRGLG